MGQPVPAVADDVAGNQTWAHVASRIFVRPLLGTWVRPNHLTWLRIAIGAAACLLLAVGAPVALAWSGVAWIVACLLDRADGELARMGDMRSEAGHRLDLYADTLLNAGWFLGAGIGLRHGGFGPAAPALGALVCGLMLFCSWISEVFEEQSAPGVKIWRGFRRFHPDDALFLLAPATWLGWLAPILIASSAALPIVATVYIVRYLRLRRDQASKPA